MWEIELSESVGVGYPPQIVWKKGEKEDNIFVMILKMQMNLGWSAVFE